MNLSVNPLTFQSLHIETEKEQKIFLGQLSQILSQITQLLNQTANQVQVLSSATGLAGILSSGTAYLIQSIPAASTSQTINCAGVLSIWVSFTMGTAFASPTVTLNNVPDAIPVLVRFVNNTATAETFFLKCTTKSGATGTAYGFTGTTLNNLSGTGISMAANAQLLFFGMMSGATSVLFMVQG